MESTPAPNLEHASISSVLTPPDDDEAVRQIDELLYQSGPQHGRPESNGDEHDLRRALLYEDGDPDYITPRIKKRLGRISGNVYPSSCTPCFPGGTDNGNMSSVWQFPTSGSSSAYDPGVPTQDKVREFGFSEGN